MSALLKNARIGLLALGIGSLAGCGSDGAEVAPGPVSQVAPDAGTTLAVAETSAPAAVAVTGLDVAYGASEERNFVGHFASPEEIVEPLPGIVLVHERWGLDDSMRSIALDLAAEGYAVMAVDLFAGRTAADPDVAQTLMSEVNVEIDAALDNIAQAIDYLRAYALAPRVALVGFGLGGGLALDTAVTNPEKIDAVVSYYGRLVFDEEQLARLRAPLLGLYAEHDASIPVRQVQEFRGLLRDQDGAGSVLIQSGVAHGFADPGRPAYDAAAAREARAEVAAFLESVLTQSAD